MISFEKIVSLEEFNLICRDTQFSKIEINPSRMKNMKDIKVKCFIKYDQNILTPFMESLRYASKDINLPLKIRGKIGGFYGNFSNNCWMQVSDFTEMKKIEAQYNLDFGIPKMYDKYILE